MSDTFEDDLLEDRIKTNVFDLALLRRMLGYCRPYVLRSVVGFSLVMVLAFFAILPPALIGSLVDAVFNQDSSWLAQRVTGVLAVFVPGLMEMSQTEKLYVFAGLFLAVRLSAFFLEWGNGYLLAGLGQRIIYDIRKQVFAHVHSLSLSYFHRQPVGRLVTRTMNDVSSMEEMFATALVTILKDICMLAGIVVFLLVINLKLGLIAMSVIPFMVVATLIFRKYAREAYRRWRAALSRINAFTAETLGGVRVVQLFHKERLNDATYDDINQKYKKHFIDQRVAWAIFRPVNTTLSATGIALVLWFGGAAVIGDLEVARTMTEPQANLFTIGLLFAFIGFAELFFTPIRDLTEKFDVVQGAMTSAERIFTILDEKREIVDMPGAKDFGRVTGRVEFDDVHFAYKTAEPVLRGVSFAIQPGQTVAIVGHTGAGKTTIINLVSRFYDVQGGRVLVDGRDTREYTLGALRRNIGVVFQDVFLFAGTVLDNVRLGDESVPRERVIEACRYVGADDFIRRLPGGYDAKVEEGGKTFSAGERQLLSFARALVFDPAILVLDEATSSIDTHTEEIIQAALRKITKGRTSIVIAHRLSTVQRADNIIVMHKGKLAESGTHQQLLAHKGIYHRLYELQYSALEGTPKQKPPTDELAELPRTSSGALRTAAAATHGNVRRAAEDAGHERPAGP
ncbi:MAG: ABC transporter ATP-binding protein [Planctomycetes bacterium]|nr:ABC transporter ATP-binding protein [Planctomycetota bacterium]MCW8136942.1 ABC transporter ATP-binding protein [Planctomycetota bacterium]